MTVAAAMPMMPLALLLQKLEQLIGTLAPKLKPQQDVAMLEKIVMDLCQSEVAAGSPLGLLIGGPKMSSTLPASRPSWQPEELAGQRDQLYMPNGRRPTVSCKQVIAKIGYMSHHHVVLSGSQANGHHRRNVLSCAAICITI
jgi:hypothetical protein